MTFIRLATVEMQVLRQQLNAIFSSLRYDVNSEPIIRKNLYQAVLNETDGMIFVESDWLAVKDHAQYYKEKIKLLDRALNEFLVHHIQNIKYVI